MNTPHRRSSAVPAAPDLPVPRWQPPAPVASVTEVAPPEAPRRLSGRRSESVRKARQAAVRAVIASGGPKIVFQPQLSLSRMSVTGYEALARFPQVSASSLTAPHEPVRDTHTWFAMAHKLGLGDQLEAAALLRALEHRDERPVGTTLAINLSPAVLTSPFITQTLPDDLSGIEIELTEHEWLPGNARLRRELDRLRERGARIAIDDVGVAHSGLRRVMELAPDRIKLDLHLVRGVSTSTEKAALIRSVVDFAEQVGCDVCAEGVETIDDLEALAALDVGSAQGWAIGMPDSTFLDVEPAAVTASQESLRSLLTSPVPGTMQIDAAVGVEHMLTRLATVTSLRQLARLIYSYSGVLGADLMALSMLTPDRASLRSLEGPFGLALGDPYRMADYPLTAQALENRTIVPVYLPCPGIEATGEQAPHEALLDGGDAAEWEVLRALEMQSVLMVPVISRDKPIGLLECYGETTSRWSRRQIRSARTVAAVLGPVLDLLIQR